MRQNSDSSPGQTAKSVKIAKMIDVFDIFAFNYFSENKTYARSVLFWTIKKTTNVWLISYITHTINWGKRFIANFVFL